MKKKILVTGGLGYIGSHTVVELQKEGFEVLIVDDLSNSEQIVLERITSITGVKPDFKEFDLKSQEKVKSLFDEYDIEGIIHFAASKAVGESVEKPLMYYQNNLISLMNLLEEFKNRGKDCFIFSSSCTVYGQADVLPITESAPFKPAESPYGKTKQMCEDILMDYTKAYEKNVIALRYFNPIGAHETAKIGELPIGVPQNLIPYVTQTAIGKRECLSVFGDDYETRDGTAVRDYIYVSDLAKAHVKSLKRLIASENQESYEVFNLGTGTGSTVLEVVHAFEAASEQKLNYKIAPRRAGDIEAAYADTKKAEDVLGWRADTPLIDSLRTAWEWEKNLNKNI
ncbi:UDP-glucose 4-epimerase [Flavobacteriaceae bacterium UJ101]|nr:UDP-glucose 4-epimerase [Flavobacteriaceae bacterium UJ101]